MRMASRIIELLPDHNAYVEPFGGSADVLMNKRPGIIEVYNDVDGDLVHFFEVLRDNGDELQEYLRTVEYSVDRYRDWTKRYYQGWRPSDDIKRAGIFFFSRYAQWGGKYEGISGFARSASARSKAKSYRKKVEELDEFQERLNEQSEGEWPEEFVDIRDRMRGVLIDNLDYREIFEKYDSANEDGDGTVFYCDPPYMKTEHRYSMDGFDHEAFADALLELEGDWILSYGTEVPEQLQSFRTTSTEVTRGIDRVSTDGKKAHERIIMSYPESREHGWSKSEDALRSDW